MNLRLSDLLSEELSAPGDILPSGCQLPLSATPRSLSQQGWVFVLFFSPDEEDQPLHPGSLPETALYSGMNTFWTSGSPLQSPSPQGEPSSRGSQATPSSSQGRLGWQQPMQTWSIEGGPSAFEGKPELPRRGSRVFGAAGKLFSSWVVVCREGHSAHRRQCRNPAAQSDFQLDRG